MDVLDNKAIGARLKEIRQGLGESQATFCKRLPGWYQTTVQRVEVGERNLTAAEAIRLADGLDLTLDEFFERAAAPNGASSQMVLARQSLARIHEITAQFAKAVA